MFDSGDTAEAVQWAAFRRGLLVLEAGESVVRMATPQIVETPGTVRRAGYTVKRRAKIRLRRCPRPGCATIGAPDWRPRFRSS